MRSSGAPSWRFSEGIDELPILALFVRDALGLEPVTDPASPPPLAGAVPDLSDRLDPARFRSAAAAWTPWWQEIVATEVLRHRGPGGTDQTVLIQRLLAQRMAVFDPPEFTNLTDRPELQDAVRAVHSDALSWFEDRRQVDSADEGATFDWALMRSVVEEVARSEHVDPATLNACAVLVPVQGIWWTRVSAGAMVCSAAVTGDDAVARVALTDAFRSSLADQ